MSGLAAGFTTNGASSGLETVDFPVNRSLFGRGGTCELRNANLMARCSWTYDRIYRFQAQRGFGGGHFQGTAHGGGISTQSHFKTCLLLWLKSQDCALGRTVLTVAAKFSPFV